MTIESAPDGLTLVDELADIEESYVSMESTIAELDAISSRISLEGISRTDAALIKAYDDTLLGSRYPLQSFTNAPSRTNVKPALESLVSRTRDIIKQIFEAIADFIERAITWVVEFFSGKKPKDDIKASNDALLKSHEERIKSLEKIIAEIRKDGSMSVDEKTVSEQKVQSLVKGEDPQLKQLREQAATAYTVLAWAADRDPEAVIKLMSYYVDIPNLGRAMENVVAALESTVETFEKDPRIETLAMARATAVSLDDSITGNLKGVAAKLSRARLHDISFGLMNLAEPDTYLTQVRTALLVAARTPSGKTLIEISKQDYKTINANRTKIAASLQAVADSFDKSVDVYTRLGNSVKRLRKLMGRLKNLGINSVEAEVEARNVLVNVNKTLRRSILSYMRLREIPFLVSASLNRSATTETAYEKALTAKLKQL